MELEEKKEFKRKLKEKGTPERRSLFGLDDILVICLLRKRSFICVFFFIRNEKLELNRVC